MHRSDSAISIDIHEQLRLADSLMADLAKKADTMGYSPQELMDANGSPLVVPLLQIRSNLVLAEVIHKQPKK